MSETLSLEAKRTQAAVLTLQGFEQQEIAEMFGVAPNTVSVWLKGFRETWKERAFEDRQARIAEEFAKLELLQKALWLTGDYRTLLRCTELKLKVLGALRPDTVIVQAPLPWDEILAASQAAKTTLEDRLLEADVAKLRAEKAKLNGDGKHD